MKATEMLHNLGQSIWLDKITRELLDTARLKSYIDDLSAAARERGRCSSDSAKIVSSDGIDWRI
jgi:hypothetical protein